MKKLTILNLYKLDSDVFSYSAIADLNGKRKAKNIDLFLSSNYYYTIIFENGFPLLITIDKETGDLEIAIEFYKKVHNQFFGKSHISGKCIYGILSHPLHKKVKKAEFTLFESEIDFDDLYHFGDQDGQYVPEFSTLQNWMQAYHRQNPENIRRAIDYVLSQPDTPEFELMIEALNKKGLLDDKGSIREPINS